MNRTQTKTASNQTVKLADLAKTIRSKNAGTDKITFDIIFREKEKYELVKASKRITRESIAALYGIPVERISDFVEFDPAYAIKFTIYRNSPSGSPGERDIFGCQQYAPLLDIEIPLEPEHKN
ncbi:MAG: acyl-CoA synthetase [Bacillus thermozeamaize]|uniref:Acyl-CoA synthetase n=1 Tax=Bacillus thermozeamaize TaxID=230954 RepID=A0A1Y3PLR3_9BACI|nr:MAG: acyl-CoA synthetase [Bacillus thermozeamaize]